MNFSIEERKELLRLLNAWEIKVCPLSGGIDDNIWYIRYLGKRLFIKKTREKWDQKPWASLDHYIRPDLLLKYKKLLHNEIVQIQSERKSKTFYDVKFPDIAVVDQKHLVTKALQEDKISMLQNNNLLINFILIYLGNSFNKIPKSFWSAIYKYNCWKGNHLSGSDKNRYLKFKDAIDNIYSEDYWQGIARSTSVLYEK